MSAQTTYDEALDDLRAAASRLEETLNAETLDAGTRARYANSARGLAAAIGAWIDGVVIASRPVPSAPSKSRHEGR